MNQFNPMQMMGMLGQMAQGKSPGQMVSNILMQKLQSHPLFQRAQQMASGKSDQDIQTIARNLCRENGIDFDQAVAQFREYQGSMR